MSCSCITVRVEKNRRNLRPCTFRSRFGKTAATRIKTEQIAQDVDRSGQAPPDRSPPSPLLHDLAVDREIEPLALDIGVDPQADHQIDQLQQDQADDRVIDARRRATP